MKRIYLYIFGGLLIVLLTGFWVYSFLYGSPANNLSFTDLSIFGGRTEEVQVVETPPAETEPVVNVAAVPLRQLTTRPVIGASAWQAASSSPVMMRYAEAGTGHIFEIDLVTGAEKRISNVSVPTASEAIFSPNGEYVAIRSGYTNTNEVILVTLKDGNGTSRVLPHQPTSMAFSSQNELLFTEVSGTDTEGKTYNPLTQDTKRIFTVPFTAVTMIWSTATNTPHYVYPKASSKLMGYLYKIESGAVRRMPIQGYGLTASANARYISFTYLNEGQAESYVYDLRDGSFAKSPITTLTDKCVFDTTDQNKMYCGYDLSTEVSSFPDNWYQGEISFDDRIWEVHLGGTASQLNNPLQSMGRSVDMTNIAISPDGKYVSFINKNDHTLWLFDSSIK
jgi:hypothetical protein